MMTMKRFTIIALAALAMVACTPKKTSTLKEQYTTMDSLLSVDYQAAIEAEDTQAMETIYAQYVEKCYQLIKENLEDEWVDTLVAETWMQLKPAQKEELIPLLPKKVLEKEHIKQLIAQDEAERRTSAGCKYIDLGGTQPNGENLQLSELVGQTDYVLLDFWATWCGPCRRLLPKVKEIYDSMPQGRLEVLGISCDKDIEKWKTMIEEQNLNWRHINVGSGKENAAYDAYGVIGIPTTILINRDGVIVARNASEEELKEILK